MKLEIHLVKPLAKVILVPSTVWYMSTMALDIVINHYNPLFHYDSLPVLHYHWLLNEPKGTRTMMIPNNHKKTSHGRLGQYQKIAI